MSHADVAEILKRLLQDVETIESMTLDSSAPVVRGFRAANIGESISSTGEKSFVMRWSYIDPKEHAKFAKWLAGEKQ